MEEKKNKLTVSVPLTLTILVDVEVDYDGDVTETGHNIHGRDLVNLPEENIQDVLSFIMSDGDIVDAMSVLAATAVKFRMTREDEVKAFFTPYAGIIPEVEV